MMAMRWRHAMAPFQSGEERKAAHP